MRKIFSYLRPYFARMSIGLSIKFIGTILDLSLPWILARIIDDVIPQNDMVLIFIWAGVMLICAVLAFVTNIIANRMASRVARNTTETIRHDVFEKSINLSSAQIDDVSISSLEARLTSDTYNVHQMVGMMQRLGVRAPILLLGGILITLTLEPVLTLVLTAILPFVGILVWQVSKRGIPLYTKLQGKVDSLVGTVRENMSGIRVIKALSKTEYEKQRFSKVNQTVVDNEKKAAVTMALTNPMMNILLNLGLTVVIIVGAYRVNGGLTQPGKIIAFMSYFIIILNAMLMVTRMFVIFSKGSASASRLSTVLDLPVELGAEKILKPAENESVKNHHIVFKNVSFSYHKHRDNISNISFEIEYGKSLGIIGATGSGKSTLIQLLMRFYDTDKGEIFIDERPIRSIPSEELHKMFGVVFQNDTLFADTISENIDFGRNLSKEQVEMAAEHAQAKEFISSLNHRFEHMLTVRGSNLSGGQKQRLLIARALALSPQILILDDSSSALDYKTDSLVRNAINEIHKNTTKIIVAQRVSSIMQLDNILVLDEGKELGYGTHEELLKSCELYREIYTSQMGGGQIA